MARPLTNIVACLIVLLVSVPSISFSQPVTTASGDGLAYTLAGEGRLLVFIHGSNLDHRMWASQIERFSSNMKVLAYDLRGLGSSNIPTEPYSDVTDLARLLEEVGESRAILVGLSAGAQVALDFAVQRPDQVEKLVLVSPSLNGFVPEQNPAYLSDLIAALRQQDYDRANGVLLDSPIMFVPIESEDVVREMVTSSKQWQLPYGLVQQSPEPVISNLDKIDISTLILLGEEDISAVMELGKYLMEELPNADLIVVPEGHHLLNISNPDAFDSELESFVKMDQR